MKQTLTSFKILTTIALLALAIGCANPPSKENSLLAAGFHVIVPKTAAQQKLKALPHDKVTMVQEHGKTYYVFPDAAHNQAIGIGPRRKCSPERCRGAFCLLTGLAVRGRESVFGSIIYSDQQEMCRSGGWSPAHR